MSDNAWLQQLSTLALTLSPSSGIIARVRHSATHSPLRSKPDWAPFPA